MKSNSTVPKKGKKGKNASASIPAEVQNLDHSQPIKQLIALGKEKGFLTIEEINNGLPSGETNPERMDEVFTILSDMNIEVNENAGTVGLSKIAPQVEEEESADGQQA